MTFSGPGVEMIAEERRRQVKVEGFSVDHDDQHDGHELALAAVCYATPWPVFALDQGCGSLEFHDPWPATWDDGWDKRRVDKRGNYVMAHKMPVKDRIRDLVKAGALIAAEIDRLLRTPGGAK